MRGLFLVTAALWLAACGGDRAPDRGEVIGGKRAAVFAALQRGSIVDAEAAFADLQRAAAGTEFANQRDLVEDLAELYWTDVKEGPQVERTVLESVKKGNDCSAVGQVLSNPAPVAVKRNRDRLVRGRELARTACRWWWAADFSALLGDVDALEADLAAGHREDASPTAACGAPFVGPSIDRDFEPARFALAAGDTARAARAAEQARTWGARLDHAWPAVYTCRANLVLGWLAEQRNAHDEARKLYQAIPPDPPAHDDDCYITAAARLAALQGVADGKPLPLTRVTGSILPPPDTRVRAAFIFQPATEPLREPALFGNKAGLRTYGLLRDQYYFVDVAVDPSGPFAADLPPGLWLLNVELEPAGKWEFQDCQPMIQAAGKPISIGTVRFVPDT